MSKSCPNCGVNSPDNAKFCIECGYSLDGVPINKEDKKPVDKPKTNTSTESSSGDGDWKVGCIIILIIVFLVVGGGYYLLSGFFNGSGEAPSNSISVTFDQVYAYDFKGSDGTTTYNYYVEGYINNMPDNTGDYHIKTIYYDKNGNELTSTTDKLSKFDSNKNSKYSFIISSYYTKNYIDVDHVSVEIIKDNTVLNEFNATMNKNKLTTIYPSLNSSGNPT